MSANIPFDIQVEIIKRLPVKSLAVFRSVSKAWKSTIDSPLFITDYSNLHQHRRVLIKYEFDTFDTKYVSIVDNDTLSEHTVCNVPVSFQGPHALAGTSQGLLCLFGISQGDGCVMGTAMIWNPSLGKSITIDVPYLQKINGFEFGFGVRPDNCDPMIVFINYVEHCYQVMMFELSSRAWRVPRGSVPCKSIKFLYSYPAPTDNRCIYWKAFKGSIYLVVAFDMVSEDFTEINLPHSVAHGSSDDFSISKIKESLALLEYYYDAKRVCGVWMMVEDGVSKSFTKLFTINTQHSPLKTKVLGFSKNDQPIMTTTIDWESIDWESASVEVYEPRTGTIKNLGIDGKDGTFFCCSYTETLILLDQLDDSISWMARSVGWLQSARHLSTQFIKKMLEYL